MSLILHLHPLSSFCHKVLMALYENGTPFTQQSVNLTKPDEREAYLKLSPFGKIPALEDTARSEVLFETTIIIEYLQRHFPGPVTLIPADADAALTARLWDRLFDLYVHQPMQQIVADKMRPEGAHDPTGVEKVRATMHTAFDLIEKRLAEAPHPGGASFTIADCAAAPALFYAQAVAPFAPSHSRVTDYFERLAARPSFVRLIGEAKPFLRYFPFVDSLPKRFTA
jgi:glutathione S-transferase